MAILNILKFPNENLKKKSNYVKIIDKNIINIIKDMIDTMFYYKGIGIAAPQININKNIIIINISENNKQILTMINPKIIYSNNTYLNKEGCLSFPNIFITVKRKQIIKIKFLNINGTYNTLKTNNLLSACIQHETDHLNGITLYNKMSKLKKNLFLKKIK